MSVSEYRILTEREYRILTERLIDPDNSPCTCSRKPTEPVHLVLSFDVVGWQCSSCGHRWPTDWARERSLNVREQARAFRQRQERG